MACAAMASCEIDWSDNGSLDGNWQLSVVDTLATNSSVDMKGRKVFWAVQYNLLQATETGQTIVLFRFKNTGDSLLLSEPRLNDRDDDDDVIPEIDQLQPMGINSMEEHYKIVKLSSSSMVLQNDMLRLHFRKY